MNADRLLAVYDRVAEAPDAIPRLRRFILNLAVRGKLVKQDPTDEPASELLKRIKAEQVRLMKAGMIKKSKASSRIDRTDIPFEAPMHWAWLRLCDIGRLAGGMTPSKSRAEYWGGSVMWLSPKDIKANEVSDSQLKITEKGLCDTRLELFPAGSLFIVARSGILKRTFPVAINRSPSASNQDLKILVPFLNGIERYLQVMFSGLTEFILKNLVKTGTTVQSLKYSEFESQPFPLPPLPEQHRIVAKVDELMSLCDRLEANRNARESTRDRLTKASYVRLSALHTSDETFRTHTRFTLDALPAFTARVDQIEQLRQTILNLAARGKLVEQDPTDEPAGDLMKRIATARLRRTKVAKIKRNLVLRSVSTNNMPYDLPESWRWAYFGSIADFSAGRTPPRKNTSYWNTGEFPWITIADMVDGATVTLTKETVSDRARTDVFKCEPVASGTMIMSFKLTIGKIARLGIPAFHNEAIIAIRPYLNEIDPFLFKVLPDFARRGDTKGAIKGATLNRQSISKILIPLPPVAEQHRIVAKIDELMTLCDRLESGLSTLHDTRRHLLKSVLRAAF